MHALARLVTLALAAGATASPAAAAPLETGSDAGPAALQEPEDPETQDPETQDPDGQDSDSQDSGEPPTEGDEQEENIPEEIAPERYLALRGERVIVRPGEELEGATVLVLDGRIVRVGADVEVPEGVRVLEGPVVCAGFVDPWSALGVTREALRDARTSAASRAADALDAYGHDHLLHEALRGGVTSVRAQAGVDAKVGGLAAVVRVDPELGQDEALLLEEAALGMSVGLTAMSDAQSQTIEIQGREIEFTVPGSVQAMDPFDRVADLDRVLAALEQGREYRLDKLQYREDLAKWQEEIAKKEEELEKDFKKAKKKREEEIAEAEEKDKEFKEKRYREDRKPREPKYDADKEVLARVVTGELPLVVQAHRPAEIRGLLEGTRQYERLRLVLVGATGAAAFAEELAERDVPVVLRPSPIGTARPNEWEGHDLTLAARLHDAGVRVLIGSGATSGEATRDLALLAGLAVGHGLDREAAFAALTVGAARVLDVADRVGTVERGKDADLLVLDGPPLVSTTRVRYVVAGGRVAVSPESQEQEQPR